MVSVIADVLKANLTNLEWMERFGGLVVQAVKPTLKQGADGAQVQTGQQVYPVACTVNMENCWEREQFRYFEPDSRKSAVAFFVDNGGAVVREVQGPKNAWLKFSFDIKFLCWLNTARLGESITDGNCLPSGRIAPYVISQLWGEKSAVGVFNGGIEETIFQGIEVTNIRELVKSPSMFEPFTFAKEGINKNHFIYPYDYFGLQIQGTFVMNVNCLPEFGLGWTPNVGCLAPAGDVNWFSRQAVLWLAALPVFDSNEDAISGNLSGGGTVPGLSIGDPYWGSPQHVAFSSSFLRVE